MKTKNTQIAIEGEFLLQLLGINHESELTGFPPAPKYFRWRLKMNDTHVIIQMTKRTLMNPHFLVAESRILISKATKEFIYEVMTNMAL